MTVTTTRLSPDQKKRGIPELGQLHNMRHIYGPVHALQVLPGNTLRKRQTTVSPTSMPTYASACSSLAAYSSACSCLGVARTTITAAAATSTSVCTITETSTPSLPSRVASSGNSTAGNSSTTATPSATLPLDTACGETTTPFSLRVSAQPGSLVNGWWAHLSGDGVLFTSEQSLATNFSVEGSGHLCAVGHEGALGDPVIAVVTNLTDSGAVWLVDARRQEGFAGDYVPLSCQTGGGGLACGAGATRNWVGCGLQLDLSSAEGSVVVDGLNCSAISLEVV